MRRLFPLLLAALALLVLPGCPSAPCTAGGQFAIAGPVAAATSPCAAAASPCAAAAAAVPAQYFAAAPAYATAYGPPGFEEHAKAVLAVPPGVIICLAQGLHCALNALWPTPGPSTTMIPVANAPYQMVMPTYAAPAPQQVPVQIVQPVFQAPMQAPCAPRPAAASPCAHPEPVSMVDECPDGCCRIAKR